MRKEKILLLAYQKAVEERQKRVIAKIYLCIALLLVFSFLFF
jgi:hypothetical protein